MRALISGGAGFIGSHLCERLVADGHSVICLDNLCTGSLDNIRGLLDSPGFRFIEGDVAAEWDIEADLVAHLASPASPIDYTALPVETMLANSIGTYQMLELARRYGGRFLLASTSEVYGDPEITPQSEEYFGHVNPIGPRSCYDESKRFAEALTFSYIRLHGVNATVVRIFNTFGPRMRRNDGRVVPNFINQALAGEPLTIYGDGSQTRSFCFVEDMVEALSRVLARDDLRGEVINLGSERELTVRELALLVKELTGTASTFSEHLLPQDDPERRRPELSKARALLDWEARVSLEEGLRRVVDWFAGTRKETRG
ncbi:MAG: UDP-glucuronic acid decarboxylase family protein [Candidatus Geothermincolia bacterium]